MTKKTFLFILFIQQSLFSQIDSLKANYQELNEVIYVKKDPISEKFSVIKLDKLDIYFNPSSNGDALKAITILPSSTNTNESVNPTLRAGDPDRTRIILNGVPITNPVRNSNQLGFGNFSLFNTEIIQKQYVYASNPPLTYSNSSAGLVEIETNKKIDFNQFQVSLGLSNIGFLLSKKNKKEDFFQVYSNYQFPKLFMEINKGNLDNLNSFGSNDFGLNVHKNINKNSFLNSFNYFINESFDANTVQNNFSSNVKGSQKRFFSVNNLEFNLTKKSKIIYANLFDYSLKNYDFGSIRSEDESFQIFNSVTNKIQFDGKFSFQYGFDYNITNHKFDEIKPIYYFNLENQDLTYKSFLKQKFNTFSGFLYINYELSKKLGFSSAIRSNVPIRNQENYVSYQFSSYFNPNRNHKFILSSGKYFSYSNPSNINHQINLLSSNQFAIDYNYSQKSFEFSSAFYLKQDKGDFFYNQNENLFSDKIKSSGFEVSVSNNITKSLKIMVSNVLLNQKMYFGNQKFTGNNNLDYFIKSQLTYTNFKLFNASLSYISRKGNYYTPVINSFYNDLALAYQPIFSSEINSSRLESYNRLDFTINKMMPFLKKNSIIYFISFNNILNKNNQNTVYYNKDYSEKFYNLYQKRIIYFGLNLRFNNF